MKLWADRPTKPAAVFTTGHLCLSSSHQSLSHHQPPLRLTVSRVALVVKNLPAYAEDGRYRFNPWVGNISWRRKWQPTPVSMPEGSHGQGSLVGYGPQGHKELDMIEATEHARKHKADSNTQLTLCWQLLSPFGHSLISSAHSIVGGL